MPSLVQLTPSLRNAPLGAGAWGDPELGGSYHPQLMRCIETAPFVRYRRIGRWSLALPLE